MSSNFCGMRVCVLLLAYIYYKNDDSIRIDIYRE